MPPPFRNGETLTIEGQLQRDPYGDPLPGGVSATVDGCAVTPRLATRDLIAVREITNYRDTVIIGLTAHMPVGTEITAYDVVVRSDGTRWQVVGEPATWYNPHIINGRNGCVEVSLERVVG